MKKAVLILPIVLAFVLLVSGCTQTTKNEFKLPDSFITMIGGITPTTIEACNAGNARPEDLITSSNCMQFNSIAPCLWIPLVLVEYMEWNYTSQQAIGSFVNNLNCSGHIGKAYCQIKMDNEIVVRQGCMDTGFDAVTPYYGSTDLTKTHTFTVCCSATDTKSGFDTCKSFTLDKIC